VGDTIHPNARRIELEKAGPKIFEDDVEATIHKAELRPGRYTVLPLFADSPDVSPAGYVLQMDAAAYAVVTAENVVALGVPIDHDTEIPVQVDKDGEGNSDGYLAWVKAATAEDGTIRINHRSRAARLSDLS